MTSKWLWMKLILILSNPQKHLKSIKDIKLRRAIERNLEIIGEAMNRILKLDPHFQIENTKRIIGLRNQIIQGYDTISDENIWGILINHLPQLKL